MDLLDDLDARGLVHDTTDRDALRARLAEGPITLYYGCDPTADSLHVGNLIGLLVLRRFADAGHRPIALAGGATGMIGDPGGRSEERNLLDEETLRANVAAIKEQIAGVLGDADRFVLVDNYDWTREWNVLDFLRDVGKHVTVNQMLAKESVKARIESEHGISYTEFSYMLLQAADYRWLHDHHGCELQIGGSDQWGNILTGVDLIRRTSGATVHALCWPLLLAPDGSKLGKTTGARTWLSAERTSPYRFFQHWMHTDDRQVEEFLAKFTLLEMEEVRAIAAEHRAAPERRAGQRRLAREVTAIVHGPAAAEAASAASEVLFGGAVDSGEVLATVANEVPTTTLARQRFDEGVELVDLLVEVGLAASKGAARRLVAQGGAYVNNVRHGGGQRLSSSDLVDGRWLLLRQGKATYHLVDTQG